MSRLSDLLAAEGPLSEGKQEQLTFAQTIERALRVGRGETFEPTGDVNIVGQSDFLEGLIDTAQRFTRGVLEPEVFAQAPQRAAEPIVLPNVAPDLLDKLQGVAGAAAPFVAGSVLAPMAAGGSFLARSGAEALRGGLEEAATGGGVREIATAALLGAAVPGAGAALGKLAKPITKRLGRKGVEEAFTTPGQLPPREVIQAAPITVERFVDPRRLELEAGKELGMLDAGGFQFADLVEGASQGNTGAFRSALTVLRVQPSEIEAAIRVTGRAPKGQFISDATRGDNFVEYIRRVQEGSPLPEFPDPLVDKISRRLQEAENGLPSSADETTEAILASMPPGVRAQLASQDIIKDPIALLRRLDRISRGRPFAQKGSQQFRGETGVKKALVQEAGLTNQQAKLMIEGPLGSGGGMTPIERVLLGRQWDDAVKTGDPGIRASVAAKIARHANPRETADFLKRAEDAGADSQFMEATDEFLDELNPEQIKLFAGFPIKWQNVKNAAEMFREARFILMLGNMITFSKNWLFTLSNQGIGAIGKEAGSVIESGVGVARRLAGKTPLAQTRPLGQLPAKGKGYVESLAESFGFDMAFPKALKDYGKSLRVMREELSRPPAIPGIPIPFTKATIPLGRVARIPFTILKWQDNTMFNLEFASEMYRGAFNRASKEVKGFKNIHIRADEILQEQAKTAASLTKQAGRQAKKDLIEAASKQSKKNVLKKGLVPTQDEIEEKAQKILENLAPEELVDAKLASERAIFIAREGLMWDKFLDVLEQVDEKSLRAISSAWPFRRTPANEAREFLRATPIGYINAYNKYTQMMKPVIEGGLGLNSQQAMRARGALFDEVGRATMGTLAIGAIMGLVANKTVGVNRFNKNRALRTTEASIGERQDSITFGDWNIPARNLGGLGRAFLIAADAVEAHEKALENGTTTDAITAAASALVIDPIVTTANELFWEDFSNAWESLQDPTRGAVWAQRQGGSFVPSQAKQIKRATRGKLIFELTEKEKQEAKEGFGPAKFIKNFQTGFALELQDTRLEGLVDRVGRPRVGLFGEDVSPAKGAPGLFAAGKVKDDPLVREMLLVGSVHGPPDFLTKIDTPMNANDELTFLKAKGFYERVRMNRMFSRPGFQRLSVEVRKKKLDDEFTKANTIVNKRARNMLRTGKPLSYRMLLRGLLASGEQ